MLLNMVCMTSLFVTKLIIFVSDYYWRQYLGEIPPDAIVGGHDSSGKLTYIGQAYIISNRLDSQCAIIPVEIHQGIPSVNVPIFGVKENTTTDIKVSENNLSVYSYFI